MGHTLPVNLPLIQYSEQESSAYLYLKPMNNLWEIFEENVDRERFKEFLKEYYNTYKFSEVNTEEFIRFFQLLFRLEG